MSEKQCQTARLIEENEKLKKVISELESEIDSLEEEIDSLNTELLTAESEACDLLEEIEQLRADRDYEC